MNDIRRTILWVVFGFSLVMLWDQWQLHNGRMATFFPTAVKAEKKADSSASNPAAAAVGGLAAEASTADPAGRRAQAASTARSEKGSGRRAGRQPVRAPSSRAVSGRRAGLGGRGLLLWPAGGRCKGRRTGSRTPSAIRPGRYACPSKRPRTEAGLTLARACSDWLKPVLHRAASGLEGRVNTSRRSRPRKQRQDAVCFRETAGLRPCFREGA
jgi:hypothetical protein